MTVYAELVAKGCTCGNDPVTCPVHPEPSDARGLAAFYKAGMPLAFPLEGCVCSICSTAGCVMYPDVELDDPGGKGIRHRPTLICPHCSSPAAERRLRAEVEETGRYVLNAASVFGVAA